MNRRSIFSRLAAIPLALAGVAITRKSTAEQLPIFAHPQPQPSTYIPPPPDTRSPREVWQEAEDNITNYVNGIVDHAVQYRPYRNSLNPVSGKIYLRLKDRLKFRGMSIDEQVIGGDTFLIIHGSLYTISRWW
jgi:hypothetical protein